MGAQVWQAQIQALRTNNGSKPSMLSNCSSRLQTAKILCRCCRLSGGLRRVRWLSCSLLEPRTSLPRKEWLHCCIWLPCILGRLNCPCAAKTLHQIDWQAEEWPTLLPKGGSPANDFTSSGCPVHTNCLALQILNYWRQYTRG